tara:strand:+ start:216 stop:356 length:141 start_codon:yes stop_codon:yes gene_type:complete
MGHAMLDEIMDIIAFHDHKRHHLFQELSFRLIGKSDGEMLTFANPS